MAKNLPINSVYGDTGSVEATYTKDLNTIGNDPYVRVVANSGEFNLFQQMNLSDNFYDSRFEEVYVTQNSAGAANALSLASIQFNTMGWSRVDRMYLQIPVVFNYFAGNDWHAHGVDPALNWHVTPYPDPTLQNLHTMLSSDDHIHNDRPAFINWLCDMVQVDFALMEIFNRIQVYAGNNNQPIGRTQSFFKEGMKTQLREVPWNENTIKILANWGLPVSNLTALNTPWLSQGANTANIGSLLAFKYPGDSRNVNDQVIPYAWKRQWANLLNSVDTKLCGSQFAVVPLSDNHVVYNQAQMNITLPLSYINNFFRHKTYLPPDFKLKIDVEGVPQTPGGTLNFNCPIIAVNALNELSPRLVSELTQDPMCYGLSAGINFSQIKLIYQNHTLRQPIQAQINEKWLAYPIVYNYETFEQFDVDNSGNNSTTMIVRDIAISQQRPTQLIFQIIDAVTACPDLRGNFAGGAGAPMIWTCANTVNYPYQFNPNDAAGVTAANAPHGTARPGSTPWTTDLSLANFPCTVAGALSTKGIIANLAGDATAAQAFVPSTCPIITTISTLIGGRTQYYYKNDTILNYNAANTTLNAYDILIAEQDAETYKDYSTETNVLKNPLSYTSLGGLGSFQRLTIAPGGYVNTADIPTDLGATVIRVQVTLSRPLPSTKKLQIVKKMPEQIAVDTNKNCTLIMWPAIKSNNGFAIPNVVNTQ